MTPVLSSTVSYLTDVRDQVMSLIRFAIMNPGHISNLWDGELLSCRLLGAKYDFNKDRFVEQMNLEFNRLFSRKFPDLSIDANFYAKDYDETQSDGRFSLSFDVTIDKNGSTEGALIQGDVNIDKSTYDIELNFKRSQDTASI